MKIITLIIFLFLTNNASSIEVNFHAWGGSNNINDYIGNLREDLVDYGIDLKHTKISDTESSVNLILSESINKKSKVDLIWINGENFQKLNSNLISIHFWFIWSLNRNINIVCLFFS